MLTSLAVKQGMSKRGTERPTNYDVGGAARADGFQDRTGDAARWRVMQPDLFSDVPQTKEETAPLGVGAAPVVAVVSEDSNGSSLTANGSRESAERANKTDLGRIDAVKSVSLLHDLCATYVGWRVRALLPGARSGSTNDEAWEGQKDGPLRPPRGRPKCLRSERF